MKITKKNIRDMITMHVAELLEDNHRFKDLPGYEECTDGEKLTRRRKETPKDEVPDESYREDDPIFQSHLEEELIEALVEEIKAELREGRRTHKPRIDYLSAPSMAKTHMMSLGKTSVGGPAYKNTKYSVAPKEKHIQDLKDAMYEYLELKYRSENQRVGPEFIPDLVLPAERKARKYENFVRKTGMMDDSALKKLEREIAREVELDKISASAGW